ncbi:hypothetical protein PSYRMG_04100 [Pseudomonas syringae UMAF0158]|nr:hypothetical protein PSYRMG_04100 [Pseudomonas syringae UMAF0158]
MKIGSVNFAEQDGRPLSRIKPGGPMFKGPPGWSAAWQGDWFADE